MEYYLNKPEQKMLKLQSKAQECVSREKAVKIIRKSEKWSQKMTKMSEALLIENENHFHPIGGRKT